jgi:ABC-type multidrug transport system fused ATPase/permease subunit
VVKDGAIIETGNHEALLKKGGLYSELYELQCQVQEVREESPTLS